MISPLWDSYDSDCLVEHMDINLCPPDKLVVEQTNINLCLPKKLLLDQIDINLCPPAGLLVDQTDINLCLPTELLQIDKKWVLLKSSYLIKWT